MLRESDIKDAIMIIADMDKPALIEALQTYEATFPVDLTPEFLDSQDAERLRHLLAALCLHCGVVPESIEAQRDAA